MAAPVAIVGNLSLDRIDGKAPGIGGGPFHAARVLRALGRPALLLVKCGRADAPGLLPRLESLGVPVRARLGSTTAAFSFAYVGGRREMRVDALGDPWTSEDVAWAHKMLAGVPWVHVAPLARSDFSPQGLGTLARGRRLSLDGQGLVRPPREGTLVLDREFDPELLTPVTALKLALEEARVVGMRAVDVPEVVVTDGSGGSLVVAAGRRSRVRTRAVDADPTGAGDAFAAAYVSARAGGVAPAAAARFASGAVEGLLSGKLP